MNARPKILLVPIGSVENILLEKLQRGFFRNFRRRSIISNKVDVPVTMPDLSALAEDLDKILDNQDTGFIIPFDLIFLVGHHMPGHSSFASIFNQSFYRTVIACPMNTSRPTHLLVREILHCLGLSFGLSYCTSRACIMQRKTMGISSKSPTEASLCYSCSLAGCTAHL